MDGWEYVYSRCQTGPNADVYRVPQEPMLRIWWNQLVRITSQHVRKSRPALAVKLTEYLKKAARETGFLSGKWLIFGEGRSIEVQWVKVKEAVCASKLGACAKLSEKTHDRPRVICVYTYSFEDEADVWRTLRALHAMNVYPTSWKPDILTHLSIPGTEFATPVLKQGWFAPAHCPSTLFPSSTSDAEVPKLLEFKSFDSDPESAVPDNVKLRKRARAVSPPRPPVWPPPFTLMKATNRWKSVVEVRDDSWNCATYGRFYKQNITEVLGPESDEADVLLRGRG